MKRIVTLVWKNGLAYLLSLLTASLFFPLIFMLLEPDSTYIWWVILILSSLGMPTLLLLVVLGVLVFNLIVYKAKNQFANNRMYYVGLGISLGTALFLIYLGSFSKHNQTLIVQNFLLLSGIGAFFGFYFYILIRKDLFSLNDSRNVS
ncbi:hypothetical protein QNI16_27180 [Cytophagaceae bacterium YF14B1]|uniref:Uncharacterized protein n=1 Tax=Xanthocytophaga flava TaxID=3048013 RepID=A0AAE3QRM5_9BACT|nr:hypothetical protein [Xanthocytophaga flavus]MDJ1484212.1 hypothetical protein [Xanthocytophaga flavus]